MLKTKGRKALDESEWRFLTDHSGHSVKTPKGLCFNSEIKLSLHKRLLTKFKNKT